MILMKKPIIMRSILLLISLAALSCRTSAADLDDAMKLVRAGARTIDGASVARAFHTPLKCAATSFDMPVVHDNTVGCLTCISFDVKPGGNCRFEVERIYLSINGPTSDEVRGALQRYVQASMPEGASQETENLPTSSPDSSIQRVVFHANGKSFEAQLQLSKVKSTWVGSAVLFQY